MIDILNHIYIEYTLAVILITQLIKSGLQEAELHPKWITFGVAIVLGVVGVIIKLNIEQVPVDFYKMLNSVGVSVLGYDYIWKPISDKFKK